MMSRTTDLWRRRSSRAAATVVSPSTSPHDVIGRFVVTIVESAADLSAMLAEAVRQATTGRPAPVALIVPENVLDEEPPAYPARVKAAVARFRQRLTAEVRSLRGCNALMVIITLNPIIRGWAAYYRGVVSKEVFATVDEHLWRLTYRWALRWPVFFACRLRG